MTFIKPALISNPTSGLNKTALAAVDAVARMQGLDHYTPSLEELSSLLHTLAASGVDLLIINGGDGTVDAIIACLRRERPFLTEPTLALLRGGTTNMIHADIGLHGAPEVALAQLLRLQREGRAFRHVERSPLRVDCDSSEAFHGFFLGLGAVPRAIRYARQHYHTKGMNGPLSELLTLGTLIIHLFRGKVENDEILSPVPLHWGDGEGNEQEAQCVSLF